MMLNLTEDSEVNLREKHMIDFKKLLKSFKNHSQINFTSQFIFHCPQQSSIFFKHNLL